MSGAPSARRGHGDAWGIGALLVLSVVLIGCASATAPTRDPRCVYVGDTVGVLKKGAGGVVQECVWLLSERQWCEAQPIPRTAVHCVVGGPMYGRAG